MKLLRIGIEVFGRGTGIMETPKIRYLEITDKDGVIHLLADHYLRPNGEYGVDWTALAVSYSQGKYEVPYYQDWDTDQGLAELTLELEENPREEVVVKFFKGNGYKGREIAETEIAMILFEAKKETMDEAAWRMPSDEIF